MGDLCTYMTKDPLNIFLKRVRDPLVQFQMLNTRWHCRVNLGHVQSMFVIVVFMTGGVIKAALTTFALYYYCIYLTSLHDVKYDQKNSLKASHLLLSSVFQIYTNLNIN